MSAIADRLEKHEAEWPKSSRHFYREQRTSMMDAERELRALAARVAELRRFAVGILDLCPHTECEGIQELAVNHGVLVEVTVTEPCGDNCECAEVSDFPLTCYRLAPEFADGGCHE